MECATDSDGDGQVGPADLSELLIDWGPCVPDVDCPSDFDGDGQVNGSDLALLLSAWGQQICAGGNNGPMPLALYECFDVDQLAVMDTGMPTCVSQQVDLHLAYNADDPQNHLRVLSDYAVGMKRLIGMPYGGVDCSVLEDADGDGLPDIELEPLVDEPLATQDTLIILTSEGNYYKAAVQQNESTNGELETAITCGQLCPPSGSGE